VHATLPPPTRVLMRGDFSNSLVKFCPQLEGPLQDAVGEVLKGFQAQSPKDGGEGEGEGDGEGEGGEE
jgi:hypothetical protein